MNPINEGKPMLQLRSRPTYGNVATCADANAFSNAGGQFRIIKNSDEAGDLGEEEATHLLSVFAVAPSDQALPHGGAERTEAAHGSALLARLYNHRAVMAPHQKSRHTGLLLLECIAEIERLNEVIRLTLEQNCHLADGDNCTLLRLKRAYAQNAKLTDSPRETVD